MIKVLLVDDEVYTREGIYEGLPWSKLGIETVVQAENGMDALEKIEHFIPNILLTDIRMPQINGIELAYKVQELNPECFIIFMSGYSDKEYLKSAIDLKAVNYIEKPLDLDELQTALKKAIALHEGNKKRERYYVSSVPIVKNDLALKLTKPTKDKHPLDELLHDFYPKIAPETTCYTLLLKIIHKNPFSATYAAINEQIPFTTLESVLENLGFKSIIGYKDNYHILIHICLDEKSIAPETKLELLYTNIQGFIDPSFTLYIAVGQEVDHVLKLYVSYNTAVIALQKLFFKPNKNILTYSGPSPSTFVFKDELLKEFVEIISTKNKNEGIFFIKKLSATMRSHDNTLDKYIRDVYFKLLIELIKINDNTRQTLAKSPENMDFLWEYISKFDYITQIEDFVLQKIEAYFEQFDKSHSTNLLCLEILQYIHANYSNSDLSLTKISQVTFLSPPYICVVFKKETGKTLIQYITDYRIEKSIDLLKNKALKVSDIAERVGFNDGNYYAKAFKKTKGLNPSEYREQYFNV